MVARILLTGVSDRQCRFWGQSLLTAECLHGYELTREAAAADTPVVAAIIGDAAVDPLQVARGLHGQWPAAGILIILPREQVACWRGRLVTAPKVAGDTRILAETSRPCLAVRVAATARRGTQRILHGQALRALNQQLTTGPEFVPDGPLAMQELLDILPVGVVVLSAADRVQFSNRAAAVVAATAVVEGPAPVWDSWPELARGRVVDLIARARERSGAERMVVSLGAGRRTARQIEISALASRGRGRRGQVTVVLEDVSLREAGSAAKSDFLASMAHELRTPLNAVLGFAQVLHRRVAMGGADARALEGITTAATHMLHLFDNMLEVACAEQGRRRLVEAEFSVSELIDGLDGMFVSRCREQGLDWQVRVGAAVRMRVMGDADKLRQVLINLIGNALKFTPQGAITLGVQRDGERFEFAVEDTGCGVDDDEQERILAPYYRGHADVEGAGLGLTITRNLLDLMHAELSLRSSPGQGSRFAFEVVLPLVRAEPGSQPAAAVVPHPLPADLAARLREAATIGAIGQIETIIEEEHARLEPFISELTRCVRAYDFGAIEALADPPRRADAGAG